MTRSSDSNPHKDNAGDGTERPDTPGDGTERPDTPGDGTERPDTPGDGTERPDTPGDGMPSILVHACCASCSSYVLEHLSTRFSVTAFYFNPNIQPESEYMLRSTEMKKVCSTLGIPMIEGSYAPRLWSEAIDAYRDLPEKSERCWTCYRFRLEETARVAASRGFDLFTSTLSVSPHKIHKMIVREGRQAARDHGIRFFDEDFKKKDGFRISVEKSKELDLTRQDYCGCQFSIEESKRRRTNK